MNKSIRNLIIFGIISMGGGFLGITLDRLSPPEDPMQGLGALLWLISPLAANLLLRGFGGDGWKDFGLKPHFKDSWPWYLAAMLIVPVAVGATLGVGILFRAVSLTGFGERGWTAFLPFAAAAFIGAMGKNIFEEFAWRGYLTPRLEALNVHPLLNSLLTGVVWAGWHIPYYLYYLDRAVLRDNTSLPLTGFIALSFVLLVFQSLAYGELRLLSKSVWTVWLLHNIANAISLPLLAEGFVTVKSGWVEAVLSPGTQGLLHSLLMGLVGLGLLWYRRKDVWHNR